VVTAVDTSVLLDALLNAARHAPVPLGALRAAAVEGSLIVCDIVLAEIAPTLPSVDLPKFLSDWNLTFVPSSQGSAVLAGEMFWTYWQRAGIGPETLPLLDGNFETVISIAGPAID
jgi:hypothetical protein